MSNDLVAVIPAFDCADSIGEVVRGVAPQVRDVIVVDDGSTDETSEVAAQAGAVVLRHPANLGKGRALRTGIDEALRREAEAVCFLDGDGQHDPRDLARLVEAWRTGRGDLVVGARLSDRGRMPSARFWTNYIGSKILSRMAGRDLEDTQSGYRVIDAGLLSELDLSSRGYAIESEMLIKAAHRGALISHVPIRTIYNGGTSHFRPFVDTVRISCQAIYFTVFDDTEG